MEAVLPNSCYINRRSEPAQDRSWTSLGRCAANQLCQLAAARTLFERMEHRQLIFNGAVLAELELPFEAIDHHLESDDRLEQLRFEVGRHLMRGPWLR